MLRRISAIFLVVLLTGCGNDLKRAQVALVSRDPRHGYEIRLDCSYRSFGGPCNLTFPPQRVSESHWIYTDKVDGEISTNHLILTYERGKTEYPWPQEALRGTVKFSNGHMRVALQTPIFRQDDSIARYEAYKLNGDYKLEMR
jgi:hypothetical protein